MERCDDEVFKNGVSLASLDARSDPAEAWVKRVAAESGQRVDWHYSGGRVHVLVLGDYAAARATAERLLPELDGGLLRWFDGSGLGLYRAGVTVLHPKALAVAGGTVVRTAPPSSSSSE
jgi:hypothetical protein